MKFPVDKNEKYWYHTKCADEKQQNSTDLERYRSGHNEAVLKTVCPQGRVGSNPTLSVHHESMMSTLGEVPKWLKGLAWKVSRSLIAARGFKSLLLRWIFYQRKLFEKRLDK